MKEGTVTAIMGPSGAAKSTLVDILAGRKSVGHICGNFTVLGRTFNISGDGMDRLSQLIQGHSAYIPQQEYFYPTQTVEEAIAFTANMKYGRGDFNERMHLIYSCLDAVGLDAKTYASRKIGGDLAGGFSIRGLSGGERKRLALACVLALKPRMMFIDEITSGLDSENAITVMKLLKHLSVKQHVASMVIIHQPNPEVFALFDRLILLSKGRCMFSGPCQDLSTFYETNYDEALPVDAVIADDLIAKASVLDTASSLQLKSHYRGKLVDILQLDDQFSVIDIDDVLSPPSALWKLFVIFQRNLTNHYIRNVANVGARLISYALLSATVGTIFWKVGNTDSSRGLDYNEAELVVRVTTFLMNISYLLPFATIPIFVGDKKFLAAEIAIGLYSPWMYGVSQVFIEFVFVTLASTLGASIAIPMCGMLNPTVPAWASFLTTLSTLIVSGLVGSTLILFCCMTLPTQDMAFLVGSTVSTISLGLSGGFLPFSDMLDVPYSLQWISPVKYSLQSVLIAQLKGTSAEKVLDLGGYNTPATVAENIGILGCIFVFFSIVTGIAMARVKEVR
mmetsp:Transcript_2694/g.4183  ORF Transcript_2694/g.4183 Transcript_2694/m.4183 type:complete len:564 (-) Transcript_2694:216-1907(-)